MRTNPHRLIICEKWSEVFLKGKKGERERERERERREREKEKGDVEWWVWCWYLSRNLARAVSGS